jgi:hypothetical protein
MLLRMMFRMGAACCIGMCAPVINTHLGCRTDYELTIDLLIRDNGCKGSLSRARNRGDGRIRKERHIISSLKCGVECEESW